MSQQYESLESPIGPHLADGGGARRRRIVGGLVSAAVVVAIFAGALPRIADYSDVWRTIRLMSWQEISALVLLGAVNIASYWPVKVSIVPGLRYRQAAIAHMASTAVSNTLPAGGMVGVAMTYSMFRSWGLDRSRFALMVLVSGVWNNVIRLGLPIVAVLLLIFAGGARGGFVVAAVVGVVLLGVALLALFLTLRSDRIAGLMGQAAATVVSALRRLVRKPPVEWRAAAIRLSGQTSHLLRDHWLRISAAVLASHISLYVVLLASLRFAGVPGDELSWVRALAGFAFVRLITALPVTPGGLGVAELGFAAMLAVGLSDPMRAKVVAAVLVFRFITYFLPIPSGAAAYVYWRRRTAVRDGEDGGEEDAAMAVSPGSERAGEPPEG